MKIAFVWSFKQAKEIYPNWRDGLRAALELIGKTHTVDWYLGEIPTKKYDFLLFWDDSNSEMFNHLDLGKKTGIILTTDPHNLDNLRKLDVVYCESEPVYNAVRQQGIRAIKAFGTDTDFYKPGKVEKDIEYFYPATFSPWKRQRDLAFMGNQLYCVGTIQPDGVRDYEAVVFTGARVEVGYFPPEHIRDLYQRAENVPIPAVHGSERTVLEAMACGIVPEVNQDNIRTYSYIREYEDSGLSPREFVLKNYSHKKYAKDILRGME